MAVQHWLATPRDQLRTRPLTRFSPDYWTVNFPAPMMAALITLPGATLQAHFHFLNCADIAGIIWTSVDARSHPLLAYATNRDYRDLTLAFRWVSTGAIIPLDAVNGPVMTLEGRARDGSPRTWYVRLWNYAVGSPTDAQIELDFSKLDGGFILPGEADPVWAGDLDRIFISVVPQGFTGTPAPLAGGGIEASVTLRDIRVDGAGVVLPAGDAFVPEHGLNIAGGYDDIYDITPERMLSQMLALGYRGIIDHYLGISHFAKLQWDAAAQKYLGGGPVPVNMPCLEWHADFFARATALGYKIQLALSFELLDAYCPDSWKQRAFDGSPALTGYTPPSTLLSPCNPDAMNFLARVLDVMFGYLLGVNAEIIFQMGEPWWWSGLGANRKPCFYDAATLAAYLAETGQPVPPRLQSVTAVLTPAQAVFADWLGLKLSAATLALAARARVASPAAVTCLLVYLPQVIEAGAPVLARANLPPAWAYPAFDRLQLEDYEFLQTARWYRHRAAIAQTRALLNYPGNRTDYFAGFAEPGQQAAHWRAIEQALNEPGYAQRFVWAFPQVLRDGAILTATPEEPLMIDTVQFPLALGYGSAGGPEFSTTIVAGQSGYEFRNQNWAQARRRYDAGIGVRSLADVKVVLAFFEARQGAARGFLFRDPLDDCSSEISPPQPTDQQLGTGDGVRSAFALIKKTGQQARRITRPDASSVRVSLNGVTQNTGWALGPLGVVEFDAPPPVGADVRAGYYFDVPVRFENDQLSAELATWAAGDLASIGLVEIREA